MELRKFLGQFDDLVWVLWDTCLYVVMIRVKGVKAVKASGNEYTLFLANFHLFLLAFCIQR